MELDEGMLSWRDRFIELCQMRFRPAIHTNRLDELA